MRKSAFLLGLILISAFLHPAWIRAQIIYDRVPPKIQTITFVKGVFRVTFDEEIHPVSINNSLELLDDQGPVAGSIGMQGEDGAVTTGEDGLATIVTLKLSGGLSLGTRYTFNVKTSITDLAGKALEQAQSISFVGLRGYEWVL